MTVELTPEEAAALRQLLKTAANKGLASPWWATLTRPLARLRGVLQ